MFANLIYYDKNKVDQYMALITKKSIIGKEDTEEDLQNKRAKYLLEWSEFEELLKNRDDYVDFTDGHAEIRIKDVKIASSIKVMGESYVRETFDINNILFIIYL